MSTTSKHSLLDLLSLSFEKFANYSLTFFLRTIFSERRWIFQGNHWSALLLQHHAITHPPKKSNFSNSVSILFSILDVRLISGRYRRQFLDLSTFNNETIQFDENCFKPIVIDISFGKNG
jgi:hypothetical protein